MNNFDSTLKEKSIFIVTFLVALISITAFKDTLSKIVIPLSFFNLSLYNFSIFMGSILGACVYLYALDYIKFGLNPEFVKFFKYIEKGADLLYIVAMLSPIFLILGAVITFLTSILLPNHIFTNILLSLLGLTAGYLIKSIFIKMSKTEKEIVTDAIDSKQEELIEQSQNFYRNKLYTEGYLNYYRRTYYSLTKILEERGIKTEKMPSKYVFRLARSEGIISLKSFNDIDRVIDIRNRAVHLGKITKRDADIGRVLLNRINDEINIYESKQKSRQEELDELFKNTKKLAK